MKVEAKHQSCCKYGELRFGECFLYEGAIWMRVTGFGKLNCAVRLNDGATEDCFKSFDPVIPVDATVTWTWKPTE